MNGNGTDYSSAACSIDHCPELASHSETAIIGSWLITAYFCREHYREMEKGTPLGGLTLDNDASS